MSTRRVIANVTVSLDGYTAGTDPYDMSWLVAHALDERTRSTFAGIYGAATTAVMGRHNYEGFHAFWPSAATDPAAHPRDRAYARWQDDVEKVVFSRTLDEVTWSNARLAEQDVAAEITELKGAGGGDILVLSSSSIIRALLEADLVDELHLLVVPVTLGGGLRFWPEGTPRADWRSGGVTTTPSGAIYQSHVRER